MADLSFSIPDDLAGPLKLRLAEGHYADAGAYVSDLIRRDLEDAADAAWVRERIAEGEASARHRDGTGSVGWHLARARRVVIRSAAS